MIRGSFPTPLAATKARTPQLCRVFGHQSSGTLSLTIVCNKLRVCCGSRPQEPYQVVQRCELIGGTVGYIVAGADSRICSKHNSTVISHSNDGCPSIRGSVPLYRRAHCVDLGYKVDKHIFIGLDALTETRITCTLLITWIPRAHVQLTASTGR